jgi:hypothetical protein
MSTASGPEVTDFNAEALRGLEQLLLDSGITAQQLPIYIMEEATQVRVLIESSFQADDPAISLAEARPRIDRLFALVSTALGFDLVNPVAQ